MKTLKVIINFFLFMLTQNASPHFLLLGMNEENQSAKKTFLLRDLNKQKLWVEEKNKYNFICPIETCNKKISSRTKLENHLITRHHVCPCCENNTIWNCVAELFWHFIENHPCQGKSRKGIPRCCFYCELCEKKITLLRCNFESHQKNCLRKNNVHVKSAENNLKINEPPPHLCQSCLQDSLPKLFPEAECD